MDDMIEKSAYQPGISVNLDTATLKNFASWATCVAVFDIIIGIFYCLGIITAAFGVPQIIAGVKLLNAAESLKLYISYNNPQKISESFLSMHKYFKLTGISFIVKISFSVLYILFYVALIFFVALIA